jgi:hypothetical protein
MKRIGELKSQIDRWPLSDDKNTPYVLSIVTLCMFKAKPEKEDIARVMDDAAAVIRDGK